MAGEAREDLLRGRQGRLLFAFLVLRRHTPVTRDASVEAIWGGHGLPPSDGALAPVLSRLRRAVAPAKLEGRDSLLLALPAPVWVDVEAAHTALDRARGAGDPAERLASVALFRFAADGSVLAGFERSELEAAFMPRRRRR